MPWSWSSLLFL